MYIWTFLGGQFIGIPFERYSFNFFFGKIHFWNFDKTFFGHYWAWFKKVEDLNCLDQNK